MKLPGLTEKQTSDLKFSVNPIKGVPRPLSPIEVMELIQILVDEKLSKEDISEALDTEKSNINNYFDRMKKLIPEVQELVGWSQTDKKQLKLGYSSVWHYSRLGEDGQRWIFKKHLENNCTRDEIRDTAQLLDRGFGTLEECFEEILDRRGNKIVQTLVTGKIMNEDLKILLSQLSQSQRDDILELVISNLFGEDAPIKKTLTPKKFHLMINSSKNSSTYNKMTQDGFEELVTSLLEKAIGK